jgi:hypothetical protein
MSRKALYRGKYLAGGYNDTPFYRNRGMGESAKQENVRVRPDLSLETTQGRVKIASGFSGTAITGVVTPPDKIPLVTVDSTNSTIAVNSTTISLTEKVYYTYTELADEIESKLQALTGHSTTTVTYNSGGTVAISGATQANPVVITTSAAHPFSTGDIVRIEDVVGMTELNGSFYGVTRVTSTTFYLNLLDGTGFSAYTSGGTVSWRKFTITNNHSTDTLIMKFGLSTTTFDTKKYLGWKFSQSIAAAASVNSDADLDDEPPCLGFDQVVFNDTNAEFSGSSGVAVSDPWAYNNQLSGMEVTLGDGQTTMDATEHKISGVWNQNKWYGSNREDRNLIMRDRYIKKMPTAEDVAPYKYPADSAGNKVLRNYTTDTGSVTINSTVNWAVLRLDELGAALLVDSTTLRLSRATADTGTCDLKFYYYVPATNTLTYIETIPSGSLITDYDHDPITGTPADADVTLTNRWLSYSTDISDGYPHYLAIEFVSTSEDAVDIHIWGGGATAGVTLLIDSNGELQDDTFDWYGEVWMTDMAASISSYNYKLSLVNADGYETELTAAHSGNGTLQAGSAPLIAFEVSDTFNLDYESVRIYRTEDGGSTYFLWADIPKMAQRHLVGKYGKNGYPNYFQAYLAGEDSWLVTQTEADDTTSRTAAVKYKYAAMWDGLLWVAGVPGSEQAIYHCDTDDAGAATPESFNLSSSQYLVGDDQGSITGLAGAGNILVVFKERSFAQVTPYGGSSYSVTSISQENVGTLSHWSCVPLITQTGPVVFFQGQNGHFYATDGLHARNISGADYDAQGVGEVGKLQETIDSLNKGKLDQTHGIYNPEYNEIAWAVCTGSNTTPDTMLVYQPDLNAWYVDTRPADLFVKSNVLETITTGNPPNESYTVTGKTVLVGAKNLKVFARDLGNHDYDPSDGTEDNNLSFDWQSADWPMHIQIEDEDKIVHDVELVMKAAATSSTTISWYVDGATSATATGTSTPGATVNEYVHYIDQLCKRIRIGASSITHDDGRLRISQALFQYTIQRSLARRLT